MTARDNGTRDSGRGSPKRSLTDGQYEILSRSVWDATCRQIRSGGMVPTQPLTFGFANRWAHRFSAEQGLGCNAEYLARLASRIAAAIVERWDPTLARPPAEMPRAVRRNRQIHIAQETRALATTSRRKLAAQVRFPEAGDKAASKTTIQRALVAAGISKPWEKATLSKPARRLAAVIAAVVSFDGKRAADRDEVCRAADVDLDKFAAIAAEITAARVSMHVHITEVVSFRGSPWLVLCRGRRPSPDALESWLERVERKRLDPRRHPFSPDQRTHAIDIKPAAAGSEEADFICVLSIANGTRSIAQWRRFIELTGPAVVHEDPSVLVDLEAIVTVVQSASRLSSNLQDALKQASGWIIQPATQAVAHGVLSIADELMTRVGHIGEEEAVREWAERVDYADRVRNGSIPGRDIKRVRALLATMYLDEWIMDGPEAIPDFLLCEADEADEPSGCSLPSEYDEGWDVDDVPDDEFGYIYPPVEDE